MAHPRAFISFDFDNNMTHKHLFAGQSKNSSTPFNIEDWSSKTHLPQRQWEEIIHTKINKCNLLIVLVGMKTYMAKGVEKEISFAKEHNVPVIGIYIDGANNSTRLPDGLARSNTYSWSWDNIATAINNTMTKGKNK